MGIAPLRIPGAPEPPSAQPQGMLRRTGRKDAGESNVMRCVAFGICAQNAVRGPCTVLHCLSRRVLLWILAHEHCPRALPRIK